ncbi:MAG: FtsX-like permease family protein [Sulfolobaceae archaeon]
MKTFDVIKFSFNALLERKTRAILVILGIMVGPLIVVSLVATIQGFDIGLNQQLTNFFSPLNIYLAPKSQGTLNQYVIDGVSHLPGVKAVVPYYLIPAYIDTPKGLEATVVFSMDVSDINLVMPGLKLQSGSLPSPNSFDELDVGYYIANPQYSGQPTYHTGQIMVVYLINPEGERISKTFVVIGQLAQIASFGGANFNQALYAPFSLGQSICGTNYAGAIVVASSPSEVEGLANIIKEKYGNYVQVTSSQQILNLVNEEISSFEALLVVAGVASFVVAFFTVLATMITSVVERTREIGLLMSLGFERRQVMLMFLSEATIMGIIGGGIGTIGGYFSSFLLASIASNSFKGRGGAFNVVPSISVEQLVFIFLTIIAITTFAGLIPAYRASKIEPAKALRYEV